MILLKVFCVLLSPALKGKGDHNLTCCVLRLARFQPGIFVSTWDIC
jgi:hypothetical protein